MNRFASLAATTALAAALLGAGTAAQANIPSMAVTITLQGYRKTCPPLLPNRMAARPLTRLAATSS